MTQYQTFIVQGKAVITSTGLRCQGPRLKQPDQACQKLLAKKNNLGQLCGSYKCERCKQIISVELRSIEK